MENDDDAAIVAALVAAISRRVNADLQRQIAAKVSDCESQFLRLLQIVDQRLNSLDKAAQQVSALAKQVGALERKTKG